MTLDSAFLLRAKKRLLPMHFESGVGHIGGNLSCLDAMMVVSHEFLGIEDRFILSKGHAAGALYITLWSRGLLTEADLLQFHRDDTLLAGHPPAKGLSDVVFAAGSLGHGLSLAAGTALARKLKSENGRVFCLTSDGEWQEGSTWEALIFATHHQLTNLTVLIDHNGLQGFGSTKDVASMAPLAQKLSGFELEVRAVDGHDLNAIRQALREPAKGLCVVILETTKGKGVSFMENRMEWHYLPLKEAQYRAALLEMDRQ